MAAIPEITPEEKAKALNCFARGKDLADKKNFEYAIEMYLSGLEYWPDAVEEGHKPCRAAALFRGGKKVGFTDKMKYSTTGKDAKKAMLNAERLLAMEPSNAAHMEAMFKNAAKAGCDATVMWVGELLADAISRQDKPNPAQYQSIREVYEALGERSAGTNPAMAVAALQRAVGALERMRALKPTDMAIGLELRDVSGKLTILKGKYGSADTFKDSVHDAEAQRDLHDQERGYSSDERMDDLIEKARAEYEADPRSTGAINKLVEVLCRREEEENENKAIGVLVKAFKETGEYRYKARAEDIRIKQYNRKLRGIAADDPSRKAVELERLRFELGVFKDRMKVYPTDMRLRYEYGRRLYEARRFDDAIPILQEARSDPKTRHHCSLFIGLCFYRKNYFSPAINTFREAINNYEMPDDDLGKQLHYWLGRSYEGNGDIADALKTYGQIIEWDYNYRAGEVRQRIDELNKRKS